jgi:hypothetical protein
MPGRTVFFRLGGQDPSRLIALKAGVLAECGVGWRDNRCLIHHCLVVRFAWDRWPKIDDFAGLFVDQDDVLVSMGLLCAAGVVLLPGRISRALAAALGPINGPRWRAFATFPSRAAYPSAPATQRRDASA